MEEKQNNTFIFYTEWIDYINLLDDKDVKNLIFIICEYINRDRQNLNNLNNLISNDRLLMTWAFIKNRIDKDKNKYDKRCETSKENGKKGGRPKKPKNLNNLTKPDNDNEYDNDYVNDNDIITTTITSNNKDIFTFIQENIGRMLNGIEIELISTWEDNEVTRYAIKQTVLKGIYNLTYIDRILQTYKTKNIVTVQQAQKHDEEFRKQKETSKKPFKSNLEKNREFMRKVMEKNE